MLSTKTIRTSHADIAVAESEGTGMPVLLIHGNSSAKEVFARQFESPMAGIYRMIAFDLPGCGASSDAADPMRSYTMPGYAEMTMEVLAALGVRQATVYGWSLGGHIALELIPRFEGLVGVMITATPPCHPTPESLFGGYRPHPAVPLIGKEEFTAEEAALFADAVYGKAATDFLRAAAKRADGRARRIVLETAFDGRSSDQRDVAEHTKTPLAIVNGTDDPIINIDYINSLTYASLWENHCFSLRGEGHAPFLTNPGVFNPILERFLRDMAQGIAKRPPSRSSKTAAA